MDPFTIHCGACASRLKVRSESAIGQRLACPKCGNMILVDAPVDGAPPETDSPKSAAGVLESRQSWESEFEEIDQLLAVNTELAKAKPSKHSPRKPATAARPQTSNYPTAVHREAQPVLPNEHWMAQSTQLRRKWLMMAAGLVSLLVLVTAVVMAITASRSNQQTDAANAVAEKEPNFSTIDPTDANDESNRPGKPDLKSDPKNVDDSTEIPSNELPDEKNGMPLVREGELTNPSNEPIAPPDPGDAVIEPSVTDDNKTNSGPEPIDSNVAKPPANPSPFGPGFENLLNQETRNAGSGESSFGELSEALENSGTSVFEINQSASVAQRRQVGVQKYFISKPAAIDLKDLKRLDDSVAGVKYSGQLLTQMLAEITQITNVPISFDAEILQLQDFDFGYQIESIEATDTSFRATIETALAVLNRQPDKPEIILEYDGTTPATITVRDGRTIRTELIPIPTLASPDQESKERLSQLIQQLVAPNSWSDADQSYSLMVDGANLSVTHHPLVLRQISEFCRKWNTALAIRDGNSDAESLASRWIASSTSRQAKYESVPKFEVPIQIFLTQLQQQTGVNVIVDWNSLLSAGWNPNTHVASGFDEPTVGEMLDELTHSMDVGWRVINANTFEITSNEIVEETPLLEFYSCAKILAGTLNAEQLVLTVRQALQSVNRTLDRARIHFDQETQCFIVVAPESIHRQLEALVTRLETSPK